MNYVGWTKSVKKISINKAMSRVLLYNVWKQTQLDCTEGRFAEETPGTSTEFFPGHLEFDENKFKKNPSEAKTVIKDVDTLVMLKNMRSRNLNPLVLNMASDYKPGGGVNSGCKVLSTPGAAQEEELFRRSNYFQGTSENFYPLKNGKCILTKNVLVIHDENYALLKKTRYFPR